MRKVAVTMTAQDVKAVIAAADGLCSYCLRRVEKLTLDHVIPIVRGGAHSVENVVAACWPCNATKGSRGPLFMVRTAL